MKAKMTNLYRHGDLLIKRVLEIPKGVKTTGPVLAEGETTGHKHRLTNGQVQVFETEKGQKYFEAKTSVSLVHEEHRKIDIEPGMYVVVNEREFDPFSEDEIRRVMD